MSQELNQVIRVENIRYDKAEEMLYIIDQTLLPNEEVFIRLETAEEMYDAIKALKVRGAPAIGICAAYSLYVLSRKIEADTAEEFYEKLDERAAYLNSSRPTAAVWTRRPRILATTRKTASAVSSSAATSAGVRF